jgi:hypothetical protein
MVSMDKLSDPQYCCRRMNEREFEGRAAESLEYETLRYPAARWCLRRSPFCLSSLPGLFE